MTMYIPVAAETEGGKPISSSRGLKMLPPPRPKAPEIRPPINEKMRSGLKLCLRRLSYSVCDFPALNFKACSLFTMSEAR